jgi:hypothetical protein
MFYCLSRPKIHNCFRIGGVFLFVIRIISSNNGEKENNRSVFFLVPALPLPGTEQWREQLLLDPPQLLLRVLNRD